MDCSLTDVISKRYQKPLIVLLILYWFNKLEYSKLQNILQSMALKNGTGKGTEGSVLQTCIILYASCPAYLQRQNLIYVRARIVFD